MESGEYMKKMTFYRGQKKKFDIFNSKTTTIFVVGIFLVMVGGITALTTSAMLGKKTTTVTNNFTPSKFTNVEIIEPNGSDYTVMSDGKLNKAKSAKFSNPDRNTKPEYIRARVVSVLRDSEGNAVLSNAPQFDLGMLGKNWMIGKDGYYYYKVVVKPNEETSNLFDDVKITSPSQDYLKTNNQSIEINVITDTVESDYNGNTDKAIVAWGVNPTIEEK